REGVRPRPAPPPALRLEEAPPADQRLAALGVDEEVFAVEANFPEVAPELRHERRPDGGGTAVDRAGELLVHGVVRHERHHRLEIIVVERLREANHEVCEPRPIHAASYTI